MANEPSEMQQQARMLAPELFEAFNDGANTFEDVVTLGWDSLDEEDRAGWEGVAFWVLQRESRMRETAAYAALELERLGMKYTVAHPENTMRVLELTWQDGHRVAADLRNAIEGGAL